MVVDIKPRQLTHNLEAKMLFSLLSRQDDYQQVFEIRGIKAMLVSDKEPYDKPRIISGYFNDADKLASTITQIDPHTTEGVYITINPCKKAMLSKAVNRLRAEKGITTTTDTEIAKRQILFLDCDPEREGGIKGIPTDEREHQTALDFVHFLTGALTQRGWPQPIMIDSGNGAYALYAIDLPTEDDGLIQRVLAGLAEEYDTEVVHIDQTAYNPARIMRVPGTWNRKADETDDRPHRQAHILSTPDVFEVVSVELLEAVAIPIEEETAPTTTSIGKPVSVRMTSPEDFLKRNNLNYRVKTDRTGKKIYILIDGCVFNAEHQGKDAAVIQQPNGIWGYHCFHDGCASKSWEDFAKYVESGYQTSKERNKAYEAAQEAKETTPKKDKTTDEEKEYKPNQTQVLLEICRRGKYFKTPEGSLCADVPVGEHYETVVIGEKGGFRMWLISRYYELTSNAASTTAIQQAIEIVAATTNEKAPVEELFTRVGRKNGKIYLDMVNPQRQVIEIDIKGWRILNISPVHFRRPEGMAPLPTPVQGGKIEELRPFLNLNTENDDDWRMIVAFELMMLHPTGPYPVLALGGEQGSTKSSTARFIRRTIDPHISLSRSAPKEERDLAIAARNNWVISLENISHIPDWLSDAMCCLSTGSGFATRALWENDKEIVFTAKRPQMVNGIGDLVTKADLLSRTMGVTLPVMDKSKYIPENKLNKAFDEAHPRILGAILNITVEALRNLPSVNAPSVGRMAEMDAWMRAAEPALKWKDGSFAESFTTNQDNGMDVVLDSSQVAKAIMALLEKGKNDLWKLSPTELDQTLRNVLGTDIHIKTWPANPKTLSDAIKKLAPALRSKGYLATHKKSNGIRYIELMFRDATGTQTPPTGTQRDATGTQENNPASLPNEHETPSNNLKRDARDAESTTLSNPEIFEKESENTDSGQIERPSKSASLASLSNENIAIDFDDEDKFRCSKCGRHADEAEDFQFADNGKGYCGDCWKEANGY